MKQRGHGAILNMGWDQAEIGIDLRPEFHTSAVIEPTVHLLGGESEGDRRKKLRGFRLALPIVRGAMSHLCRAPGNRIEDF